MVTLVSNISHYHYAAEALATEGWLDRYLTCYSPRSADRVCSWFPRSVRQKLEARRLSQSCDSLATTLVLPELIGHLGKAIFPRYPHQVDGISNRYYETLTRIGSSSGYVHFVNSLLGNTTEILRSRGVKAICDCRQEHPKTQEKIVQREAALRFGRKGNNPANTGAAEIQPDSVRRTNVELAVADAVFVPSEYARSSMIENGISGDKVYVAPYGVNMQRYEVPDRVGRTVEKLAFVGSLDLRKGLLYLLAAVAELKTNRLTVVCAGRADDSIAPLLKPYSHLIDYRGPLSPTGIQNMYAECDAFILPSLSDSFGLVVLEAAASGLPIITTANVGAAELLVDSPGVTIVEAGNPAQLGIAIDSLMNRPSDLIELGRLNNQFVASLGGWSHYKKTFAKIYRDAILRRAAA